MARMRRAAASLPPTPPPGLLPGERLRALRMERGLSQKELAKLAGIRKATLISIERGQTQLPNYDTLVRIATVFGVTVEVLRRQIGMHGPLYPSSVRRDDVPEQRRWSPYTERVARLMETLTVGEQEFIEAMCRYLQARQSVLGSDRKGAS